MEASRGPTNRNITGFIRFDPEGSSMRISGVIYGLPSGTHALQIHELGDITGGCTAGGSHFNPDGRNHGGPTDQDRHVGDLGNIRTDFAGTARVNILDRMVAITGSKSVLGLTLMINEGADDFGKGGYFDSKTTGHVGDRLACGVIGKAKSRGSPIG